MGPWNFVGSLMLHIMVAGGQYSAQGVHKYDFVINLRVGEYERAGGRARHIN